MPRASALRQLAPEDAPAPPPSRPSAPSKTGHRDVTVRHWIHGAEMRVVVPERAKFKHVKAAIARNLDVEGPLPKLSLMSKQGDVYKKYKDSQVVGDLDVVLLNCADDLFPVGAVAYVSDTELSGVEESPLPLVPTGKILPDMAINSAATRRVRNGGPLTRKQAISLMMELHQGFSDADFQQQWSALDLLSHRGYSQVEVQRRRSELRLSVQKAVFPKYGLEPNENGVMRMMSVMKPFQTDPEWDALHRKINDLLGLSQDPQLWSKLSSQCRKLLEDPAKRERQQLMLPIKSMGMGGLHEFQVDMPALMDGDSYEPWSGRRPKFDLYVLGSWNDLKPLIMNWSDGVFTLCVHLGVERFEAFQIMENKDTQRMYYPDIPCADPGSVHSVLGPDRGQENYWCLGSSDGSGGIPGDLFEIRASLDSAGQVVRVDVLPCF